MDKRELEKLLKDEFNGCPLFEGRTKGDLNELKDKVVTIKEYFPLSDYHAVVFEEEPEKVYLSGGGLKKLLSKYENEDLSGLKIKLLPMIKTNSKRDYRPIEVVGW